MVWTSRFNIQYLHSEKHLEICFSGFVIGVLLSFRKWPLICFSNSGIDGCHCMGRRPYLYCILWTRLYLLSCWLCRYSVLCWQHAMPSSVVSLFRFKADMESALWHCGVATSRTTFLTVCLKQSSCHDFTLTSFKLLPLETKFPYIPSTRVPRIHNRRLCDRDRRYRDGQSMPSEWVL